MKEQQLFNEFISEYCQNDLNYALDTLYEWIDAINNMDGNNESNTDECHNGTIFLEGEGELKIGDHIIFNTLDDELNDWLESHPSDHGYEVSRIDTEEDGSPTGMLWIKDCEYAIDFNEDGVKKIDLGSINKKGGDK